MAPSVWGLCSASFLMRRPAPRCRIPTSLCKSHPSWASVSPKVANWTDLCAPSTLQEFIKRKPPCTRLRPGPAAPPGPSSPEQHNAARRAAWPGAQPARQVHSCPKAQSPDSALQSSRGCWGDPGGWRALSLDLLPPPGPLWTQNTWATITTASPHTLGDSQSNRGGDGWLPAGPHERLLQSLRSHIRETLLRTHNSLAPALCRALSKHGHLYPGRQHC